MKFLEYPNFIIILLPTFDRALVISQSGYSIYLKIHGYFITQAIFERRRSNQLQFHCPFLIESWYLPDSYVSNQLVQLQKNLSQYNTYEHWLSAQIFSYIAGNLYPRASESDDDRAINNDSFDRISGNFHN